MFCNSLALRPNLSNFVNLNDTPIPLVQLQKVRDYFLFLYKCAGEFLGSCLHQHKGDLLKVLDIPALLCIVFLVLAPLSLFKQMANSGVDFHI